jgi:Ca2+:H+ antiporter
MESNCSLHPQLPRHYSPCGPPELRNGRAVCEIGADPWWLDECDLWECCRINRQSPTCTRILTAANKSQVSIVALKDNQIRIVQSSMLGSILSNILLVLGCCFVAGGIKKKEQEFNETVASTMSSLMAVASASLIIPATLYAVLAESKSADKEDNVLILSHGTAIILLILYVLYLFFQLKSHANLFDEEQQEEGGGEEEEHVLTPWAAGVALVLVTVLVAVCAEYLVDSIDAIVETAHISKTFIGLILLPIVGNAAEHVTAVVVAYKDKMDLAMGVAVGSSMQIALLVTPFLVILGWIMDRKMTLHFETFETVVFFLSGNALDAWRRKHTC